MAQVHEFTGKSVEEAISEGLLHLNTTREQVDVEILNQGSRGIFGLGGELARVRLSPRDAAATTTSVDGASTDGASTSTASQKEAIASNGIESPGVKPIGVESADGKSADIESDNVEALPSREALPADSVEQASTVKTEQKAESASAQPAGDAEAGQVAISLLEEILALMQFDDARVESYWQEPEDEFDERYFVLNVEGDEDELSSLIGRRSETLDALQYLLRLMVNQRTHRWQNIVVDINGYKERRASQLHKLAVRMAEQAIATGRTQSLEPMPPNERRIVHLALRDFNGIFTESSGEGERRKVHIVPED